MNILFKKYNRDNWEEALKLKVKPDQKEFAPTIAESLATAYIKPWDDAFDPYLIYDDNTMIGAFYLSYTPNSADNYWLGGFLIDEKFQNKGYGKASFLKMLQFMNENHTNCQEVKLTVEKNNIIAQKLYKSCGFDDSGEVNKYDEIIYCMSIIR